MSMNGFIKKGCLWEYIFRSAIAETGKTDTLIKIKNKNLKYFVLHIYISPLILVNCRLTPKEKIIKESGYVIYDDQ